MADRVKISLIILTKDESINIAECLQSLEWIDEAIIVDSGSSDQTVEVARETRPDIKVLENEFLDFGDQRNWAIDNCDAKHDWILFLDADERSTPEFAEAVQKAVADPGDAAGFFLCYRNFFMDTWIKHCMLFPSWQLRLFKKGLVRFEKDGHGQKEVTSGKLEQIAEPYNHYGFSKGLKAWKARHEKYAAEDAGEMLAMAKEPLGLAAVFGDSVARRRLIKRAATRLPCKAAAKFMYTYFLRLGFLDGKAGLAFCGLNYAHWRNIERNLAAEKRRRRTGGS